jgi:mRNA (guanine-N7-)-methyltransferase
MNLSEQLESLRTQQNRIKKELILEAYCNIPYTLPPQPTSFLDLSCGRGGDIHKIYFTNYAILRGVDKDVGSIRHANGRLAEKMKTVTRPFDVHYDVHDLKEPYTTSSLFDTVSMQFALHYFFDTEESLVTLLTTISSALKPGGCFIGTCLDQHRLREVGEVHDENLIVDITPMYQDDDFSTPFGHAYIFSMKKVNTTRQTYFEFVVPQGSKEYLVDMEYFERKARDFGLEKVFIKNTENVKKQDLVVYLNTIFMFRKV